MLLKYVLWRKIIFLPSTIAKVQIVFKSRFLESGHLNFLFVFQLNDTEKSRFQVYLISGINRLSPALEKLRKTEFALNDKQAK